MAAGGWKPKEKPLSPEEAIAAAKQQLAPYWVGSSPLFAGVRATGGVTIHPLQDSFSKQNWIIHFIEPLDFSGERSVQVLKEWIRRYSQHELLVLGVLKIPYVSIRNSETTNRFLSRFQVQFPTVLDHDGLLVDGFKSSTLLITQGNIAFSASTLDAFEQKVQHFLRAKDSGLPLAPVMKISSPVAGSGSFPVSGPIPGVELSGSWKKERGGLMATGETAQIKIHSKTSRVGVVCEMVGTDPLGTWLSAEVNGRPAYEEISGQDLAMDESGRSAVRFRYPGLYEVVRNLPDHERELVLRFNSGVIIHALSFA